MSAAPPAGTVQPPAPGGAPPASAAQQPPPVSLDTKIPVSQLMGAVDAIEQHHQQQAEEHQRQKAAAAAAATGGAPPQPAPPPTADGGGDKPPGYPGTFFLEKPLTPEEAHTIPRMWGPPPGGPPYQGYPPAGAPGYPPAGAPGYPPAGGPSYPPAGGPAYPMAGAPSYPPPGGPGYPPPGAPGYPPASGAPSYPPSGGPAYPPAAATAYPPAAATAYPQPSGPSGAASGGAYPQVHHKPGGAPAAALDASTDAPSAPPMDNPYPALQPAPMQLGGQPQNLAAPPASAPRPSGPPPASGKKKALIVGINYFGSSAQLNGCINDARCMEYLLKTKFGFKQENILMMTDDCPDPLRLPTRANIFQGIRWLTMDMRPGDSLVFHYSGHGSQTRDYSGEETDGMNETLCPVDFRQAGEIVDDDLNRYLVNPLPTGVKLHCIIDACHSGSVMDLPFQAHVRGGYAQWEATYHFTRTHKGTAGGFAVQFGAAKDSQTAADTKALSGNTATGAATYCFIQAIERRGTKLSYGELLLGMHHTLQATMGSASQAPAGGGSFGGLMGMLVGGSMMSGGGYRGQEPVLSANFAFDLAFPFTL